MHAWVPHIGQKRAPAPLGLELRVVVNCLHLVLGTKLRSSKEWQVLLTAETLFQIY